MKTKYPVGHIFNSLESIGEIQFNKNKVCIEFPTRLEAMALDPKLIDFNEEHKYAAGQINFKINSFKIVSITKIEGGSDLIDSDIKRPALVRHAVELMRHALSVNQKFSISVTDTVDLRHCGLGSSSNIISSIATAINELYGNPIRPDVLCRYTAQNHGEEIDADPDYITPVQCLGGSAVAGNFEGGIQILSGFSTLIFKANAPSGYKIIFGVPTDYEFFDSSNLLEKERDNISGFVKTGNEFGPTVAYALVHSCLPALCAPTPDISKLGDLIFEYRYNMGSIKNCSFTYPPIVEIMNSLAFLKQDKICDVLSISSVGPGVFAITKEDNLKQCRKAFEDQKLRVLEFEFYNGKYVVKT